jgi:rod shape-determining protein MreC
MRILYLILLKRKDIFTLVLSVILSLLLLSNGEADNVRLLRSKANRFFTILYSPITWIRSLALIEEEAALLREKNLQLAFQIESMSYLLEDNNRLEELLDFQQESKMTILPARVTNMSASPYVSSLSIDIGLESGVEENDPVITPKGIIGKTTIVGDNATIVQLINDVNFRLSVRIKPSGSTGILRWLDGDLYLIKEVQKNANVNIGNKVITSGFSDIFPNDLPVGEVVNITDERGRFQKSVVVKINENIGSIINLFVIVDQ